MSFRVIHNGDRPTRKKHFHSKPRWFLKLRGIRPGAVIQCECGNRYLLNNYGDWVATTYEAPS